MRVKTLAVIFFFLAFTFIFSNQVEAYSSPYVHINYGWGNYRNSNHNYAQYYQSYGARPYAYTTQSCNPIFGCRQVQDSHIFIRNALDNTYYKNPDLLAPRYINNQQRQHAGLFPHRYTYI